MEIEYLYIIILGIVLSILESNLTQIIIEYKESLKYKNEFYSYKYYLPNAEILKKNKHILTKEIYNINNELWDNFPNYITEKNKYWKIILLCYNGKNINKNSNLFNKTNTIIKFIKNIVNVYFSKISPHTNIRVCHNKKNYFISKYIIKLYYIISCGNNSEIIVNNKKKKIVNNDIIIFDYYDNITYKNNNNNDTIILVIDIIKPKDIKKSDYELYNKKSFDKYINNITNLI
jgi:hypothetical protein